MPKTETVSKFLKTATGFDSVVNKVNVISAGHGNCTATVKIEDEHSNNFGGLHGGFSATLVDVIATMALLTHENGERPSISVNTNLTYIKGAGIGEEILIDAKTLRTGKTLAFLEAEIRTKGTNDLLVKAEHTKFFLKDL